MLNTELLSTLPTEDFLPAVVAFKTEAAFSNKDSLDGDGLSDPFVFVLCLSFENLSNDAGREWTLVGDEGIDLALLDLAFELTISFLMVRLFNASFESKEFDLMSWGFLLSVPLFLTEALSLSSLLCSFSSDKAPASFEQLMDAGTFLLPRKLDELVTTTSSGLPTQACRPGTGLTPLKIGTGEAASKQSTWMNCPN
uniref:Uncharacterized protein n=1 Tax=Arundo donax TaxID=35708 RepID=A0A0A9CZB7_ARUDO